MVVEVCKTVMYAEEGEEELEEEFCWFPQDPCWGDNDEELKAIKGTSYYSTCVPPGTPDQCWREMGSEEFLCGPMPWNCLPSRGISSLYNDGNTDTY